jgi:hypothetical protein
MTFFPIINIIGNKNRPMASKHSSHPPSSTPFKDVCPILIFLNVKSILFFGLWVNELLVIKLNIVKMDMTKNE